MSTLTKKVELVRERRPDWSFNPRISETIITWALPFFQQKAGGRIHRVRSGVNHYWSGKYSHTTFTFWCHGSGSISERKKGTLMAEPPENAIHCATCEGRATGAGLNGAREIQAWIFRRQMPKGLLPDNAPPGYSAPKQRSQLARQ